MENTSKVVSLKFEQDYNDPYKWKVEHSGKVYMLSQSGKVWFASRDGALIGLFQSKQEAREACEKQAMRSL